MNTTIFGRFTTKECAEIYVDALNEYANNVIGACRVFSEVARKMDGKCYNVRFWRALDEALLERFGTTTFYEGTPNEFNQRNARITIENGFGGDMYFRMRILNRTVCIDGYGYDVSKEFCDDIYITHDTCFCGNGRIVASEFERAARVVAQHVEAMQSKWLDAIRFWDTYMGKLAEIDELIDNIVPKINPLFLRPNACNMLNSKTLRLMGKKFE